MIEVNLLGTGGMVPLPERHLTSLYVKYKGSAILVDCGEGTQVAIREAGLGFKQIDIICLTHFHADHIAGLPGLLLTIGNSSRTEPLTIIGPEYIRQVVECLCVIAPQLPFHINFIEIEASGQIFAIDSLSISVQEVEHWTTCCAYKFSLKRQGKFDPEKAELFKIPIKYWSILQAGNNVEVNGKLFAPSDIMGASRKGLTLCYATDLRPSEALEKFIESSDLFICEGMYGDPELWEKAIQHRHCLFNEAAAMAKKALVKELWLTHFSPSMPNPEEYIDYATDIFPNTFINKKSTVLTFSR